MLELIAMINQEDLHKLVISKVIDMVQQSQLMDGPGIQQFQILFQVAICGIQLTEFLIPMLVQTVLTVDIHLWFKRKILKVKDMVQPSQLMDGNGTQQFQILFQVAICGEMLSKFHILK